MNNLEKYITAKLDAMQAEKSQKTVHPNFITKSEFFASVDKDIRKVMNKLFVEKKIKVHPTNYAPTQDFIELIK